MAKSNKPVLSPQERTVERSKAKIANFMKLAPKRMTRALKGIEVVGNLANRNSYTYTTEQATQIVAALAEAVKSVGARFTATSDTKSEGGFKFK